MKRDMDLVRLILLEMEKRAPSEMDGPMSFEGHSDVEVTHHLKLLHEAGLIQAIDASTMADEEWIPVSLTWEGHDFLDAARDDTRWRSAKAMIMEKGGAMSFAVIKALLISLAKKALGL